MLELAIMASDYFVDNQQSGRQGLGLDISVSGVWLHTLVDAFIRAIRMAPVRLEPMPNRAASAGKTMNEARASPAPSSMTPLET